MIRPLLLFLVSGIVFLPGSLFAHRVSSVSLISYLNTKDHRYTLDVAMEVVPSEDPALNDQISPEDAAREFAEYLNVMFDEAQQKPQMEISIEETSDGDTPEALRRRQVLTKMQGRIPDGAKEFLLYLDPRCPMAVVMVAVKDEQPSRRMQVILAGEYSRPISVLPLEEGDPFDQTGAPASKEMAGAGAEMEKGMAPKVPRKEGVGCVASGWRAFFYESALPAALLIALLLLTLGRQSVLWQIGLLLATQGLAIFLVLWRLVSVPGGIVPTFAVLTAILALEALFHQRVKVWRYPLVGCAGVASGWFLAGTSSFHELLSAADLGIGRAMLFLLGVESAVVGLALASASILLPLSRFEWYRKSVVTPLGVLIAGYSLFVLVERFL